MRSEKEVWALNSSTLICCYTFRHDIHVKEELKRKWKDQEDRRKLLHYFKY